MAAKKGGKKAAKKGGAKKGGAKKAAKKGGAKKAAKKKGGAKRTPNAAFMRPMQPDAALSAVVGSNPIPRTEITKKLWAYIKRNNLQDAKMRRNINADDKLKPVFGGKGQVSMFEMTKLVNKHIKCRRWSALGGACLVGTSPRCVSAWWND
jgi:chromatin remodeling complex protein RSC6